ncbi:MAG: cobyrinate a,c-diamide synthase [Desulfomonile sp.]|nr:cobyrinate a,c-diamide synthase [Desulfomonile sp.]
MSQIVNVSRFVIAAHKGGAGKTLLSVGLAAALRKRGIDLAAFKKGPDYIDAGWLGLAAGGECYNLDSYLFDRDVVLASFAARSAGKDLALIEGNRGLFDGVDAAGSYSTAELAKLLGAGVILVIDATKMTRTAAAFVLGCRALDPGVELRGVILNRVGGARHERILTESIEGAAGVPVLGSVRKLELGRFPQRHLGLLPWHEHPEALSFVDEAASVVAESIDIDRLLQLVNPVSGIDVPVDADRFPFVTRTHDRSLRIGVLKDSAFQFYYPENIEVLERSGASVVQISAMDAPELPTLDALYIGGGFPETHAERLADNKRFRTSIADAIAAGLPVYAECGGLMYLSRNLVIDANVYPMVGALPVDTVLEKTPQGHGYIQAEVTETNPFYPMGSVLTGHEFHYSRVAGLEESGVSCAFRVTRGHGLDGSSDGMCVHNVLATYVHVHALGTPAWAEGILRRAAEFHIVLKGGNQTASSGFPVRHT